jgi:hypothetical protein
MTMLCWWCRWRCRCCSYCRLLALLAFATVPPLIPVAAAAVATAVLLTVRVLCFCSSQNLTCVCLYSCLVFDIILVAAVVKRIPHGVVGGHFTELLRAF